MNKILKQRALIVGLIFGLFVGFFFGILFNSIRPDFTVIPKKPSEVQYVPHIYMTEVWTNEYPYNTLWVDEDFNEINITAKSRELLFVSWQFSEYGKNGKGGLFLLTNIKVFNSMGDTIGSLPLWEIALKLRGKNVYDYYYPYTIDEYSPSGTFYVKLRRPISDNEKVVVKFYQFNFEISEWSGNIP